MRDSKNVKIKRWRNKLASLKYLGGECKKCGLKVSLNNICSFDFHHVDPNDKTFQISSNYDRKSWKTLSKELDKCILLCKNCHSEYHFSLIKDENFLNDIFNYNGELDIWLFDKSNINNEYK